MMAYLSFILASQFLPHQVLRAQVYFSYGSDVGILYSSIPGIKYSLCASRNILSVSAGSVIFQSTHLTPLDMMTLLV